MTRRSRALVCLIDQIVVYLRWVARCFATTLAVFWPLVVGEPQEDLLQARLTDRVLRYVPRLFHAFHLAEEPRRHLRLARLWREGEAQPVAKALGELSLPALLQRLDDRIRRRRGVELQLQLVCGQTAAVSGTVSGAVSGAVDRQPRPNLSLSSDAEPMQRMTPLVMIAILEESASASSCWQQRPASDDSVVAV